MLFFRPIQVALVLLAVVVVVRANLALPIVSRLFGQDDPEAADRAPEELLQTFGLPRIVKIAMRDGVKLSTKYWVPGFTQAKRGAVLQRSPYGIIGTELLALRFLRLGFTVVMQDMRGTGASEGKFSFWRADANDSQDTMTWIAQQQWSSGKVYTLGPSADGNGVYASGVNQPVQLRAQYPIYATGNAHATAFQGGAFRQNLITSWLGLLGQTSFIPELLNHEAFDEWWDPIELPEVNTWCNWSSIHHAGWFDIFSQFTIDAHHTYQQSPTCKYRSKIIVDPTGHCFGGGELGFQNARIDKAADEANELFVREELGIEDPNPVGPAPDAVTFYVMSAPNEEFGNYWTYGPDWPQYVATKFYFRNDGSLTTKRESRLRTAPAEYDYNPSDPVPTLGGHNLLGVCGPIDQLELESRADILTFTSEELTEPLAITGRIKATLFVSSNATDTDFTAKLSDVFPDGRSILITDGILRMRWRSGRYQQAAPMSQGQIYEVEVDLWSTSWIFNRGHSIRIAISSSNYPRFSANPNNGLPMNRPGPLVVAHNTLYLDTLRPSHVTLPIVNLADIPPKLIR